MNWNKRQSWLSRADTFCVEIMHRFENGKNLWNVYAYVYPKHPRFAKINPKGSALKDEQGCDGLHFHGGILGAISFCRSHRAENGEITSYQFGSDYDHLHDDWARRLEPPKEGETNTVFFDAERLFSQLKAEEEAAPIVVPGEMP